MKRRIGPDNIDVHLDTYHLNIEEKRIGFAGELVIESFVTSPPEIAAALCVWRPVAPDRFAVLEQGVSYLRDVGRKHGLWGSE